MQQFFFSKIYSYCFYHLVPHGISKKNRLNSQFRWDAFDDSLPFFCCPSDSRAGTGNIAPRIRPRAIVPPLGLRLPCRWFDCPECGGTGYWRIPVLASLAAGMSTEGSEARDAKGSEAGQVEANLDSFPGSQKQDLLNFLRSL